MTTQAATRYASYPNRQVFRSLKNMNGTADDTCLNILNMTDCNNITINKKNEGSIMTRQYKKVLLVNKMSDIQMATNCLIDPQTEQYPVIISSDKIYVSKKVTVMKAKFKNNDRKYAIKILGNIDDSVAIKGIENEIHCMNFRHTNIAAINAYYIAKTPYNNTEKLCTISKYYSFGDLFTYIQNEAIDEILTRTFFRDLVDGIEHIHSFGYAHMDIKPENILISKKFRLKICDFDLMVKQGTITGNGTSGYRAPEVVKVYQYISEVGKISDDYRDHFAYDNQKADIYTLGIMLFVMYTGANPYRDYDTKCTWRHNLFNDSDNYWETIMCGLLTEIVLKCNIVKDKKLIDGEREKIITGNRKLKILHRKYTKVVSYLDNIMRVIIRPRRRTDNDENAYEYDNFEEYSEYSDDNIDNSDYVYYIDISNDFKELFMGMIEPNPTNRYSLNDIKNSKWYQNYCYSEDEKISFFKKPYQKRLKNGTLIKEKYE